MSRNKLDVFQWGVATAAQQIEGARREGGRGESIWDRFAMLPGAISDGTTPERACEHYYRWRDDVGLLRELGVTAYRFSIAWPRILPLGHGTVEPAGLDFYDALVDTLLAAGIHPFVTLNHWDLPQGLQERGGWTSRSTVDAFVRYADIVTRRLGDRVGHWATHNEPWCVAHLGHEAGAHAPGLRVPGVSLRVAHHLLLSHGRAVEVVRQNAPDASVGIVMMFNPAHPASDTDADRDAARQHDGAFHRWYLDPLYHGRYPEDAIADRVRRGHLSSPEMPFVRPGDMATIATPCDYLGVNYYSRAVVKAGPDGAPVAVQAPADRLTDMGWEVYPEGMKEVLTRVHRDYAPSSIYVTENGAAFLDSPSPGQGYADTRRVEYLRDHIAAVQDAAAEGVPVDGYFVWSLMDNFEWGQGLSKRFGLYHVDYSTQTRTPRDSARWYRDFIAEDTALAGGRFQLSRRTS